MPNHNISFNLEVTTCGNASKIFFMRTQVPFPFSAYGIAPLEGCEDNDPIADTLSPGVTVRMLSKTLNQTSIMKGEDESDSSDSDNDLYEADVDNYQTMVNLTRAKT